MLPVTPFFNDLTDLVVRRFGDAFPELSERQTFIREVMRGEEARRLVTSAGSALDPAQLAAAAHVGESNRPAALEQRE